VIATGALCFWNERPEDLERCIAGLALVADRVVALDGAYARYPEATVRSPQEQVDAIRSACGRHGLDCLVLQPDRLWAGQVEKRSHLLAAASVGTDFIVNVDTDHVIKTNRNEIRPFLEHSKADVLMAPYVTPPNLQRSMTESSVGNWHEEQSRQVMMIPHIFRALPGLRVEKRHWWYSAIKDGRRQWLWGGDGTGTEVQQSAIQVVYTVQHLTLMRTDEQIRLSRGFVNDRIAIVEQTGQEDDMPHLPRPVFDFSRSAV
jgi:hypothetical protein